MLIVPQSNGQINIGRGPRLSTGGGGIADAIGGVVDTAIDIRDKKQTQVRASELRGARIATMEGLAELRSQYDNDPDFDGLGDRFLADQQILKDAISETLSPHVKDDFDLEFRSLSLPHNTAIGRRSDAGRRDHERAELNRTTGLVLKQAAAAPDAETRAEILKQGASSIGASADNGFISEVEAESMISNLAIDAEEAAAFRGLRDDPAAVVAAIDAGEFASMDPKSREVLKTRAQNAVDQELARQARAAQIEETALAKEIKARVDDAVDILQSGRPFEGLPELLEAANGTPEGVRLSATVAATQFKGNFTVLDPATQSQLIKAEAARATSDADDVARLKALRNIQKKTIEGLTKDPLQHLSETGQIDLGQIDLGDPESVKRRISLAETAVMMPGQQIRFFTDQERDAISERIAEGSPTDQLNFALSITSTFGKNASAAMAELGQKDPVFHLAGQLVLQTGETDAAKAILVGRKLLKDKQGAKVDGASRGNLRLQLATALPEGAGTAGRIANVMQAAERHFAATGFDVSPDATSSEKQAAFMQSVQAVLGARFVGPGQVQFGGIQAVNGTQTILPPSLNASMVEQALDAATAGDWGHASITAQGTPGGLPQAGGKPIFKEGDDNVQSTRAGSVNLVSIGGGQFLLARKRQNGGVIYFKDDTSSDGLFRVNLVDLVKNVKPKDGGFISGLNKGIGELLRGDQK